MPWLKFYRKERERFPEAFKIKVSDKDAVKIVNKLCRHFKIRRYKGLGKWEYKVGVRFWGNGGARAFVSWKFIHLPHNPSIGIICHELAHIYNHIRYNNHHHNKRLMRTIERMINYCKKKKYWGMVR
jgi:hypothetical protein